MAIIIRPNSSFALDAVIALDAGNIASYPQSGTTWFDTSRTRGDNATLTDVTWSSTNSGIFNYALGSSVARISNKIWDFSLGQTIMMAFQPLESDGARRNPYNQAYGGGGTWTHEPSGNINWYFGSSGVNGGSYIGIGSPFTVVQNEWAIVTSARNTTNAFWYKNGILASSTAHGYPIVNTGVQDILIGDGYTSNFFGNIAFCFVWDRALSNSEVKTYYDRLKTRFGLT
jgi:hypothetical protein